MGFFFFLSFNFGQGDSIVSKTIALMRLPQVQFLAPNMVSSDLWAVARGSNHQLPNRPPLKKNPNNSSLMSLLALFTFLTFLTKIFCYSPPPKKPYYSTLELNYRQMSSQVVNHPPHLWAWESFLGMIKGPYKVLGIKKGSGTCKINALAPELAL